MSQRPRGTHTRRRLRQRSGTAAPARPLGFIGGGNMAGALIRGLLQSGSYRAQDLWVSEPVAARRREIQHMFRITSIDDNVAVAAHSRVVILAVKPQVMDAVLAEIRPAVRAGTLFISIAAGVRIARLERGLGTHARIIRVMPNTPALVARGMSVLASGRRASRRDLTRALSIFRAVGDALAVSRESLLDPVTGLSGSGPAFVYLFAEALIAGGRAAGLSQSLAEQLAAQTIDGAAAMLKQTGKTPAELRAMVTSPGGTTLAGLAHLESKGFGAAVRGAVVSATARARELAVT